MKPLPPLKTLAPFHAVARHLSFSKAADELHVTHSAVSQSIKHIEQFLEKALFIREAGTVRLTKEGEAYFIEIDLALKTIRNATATLLKKPDERIITINMLSSFAMRWLIPRISDFQSQYPQYELRLCSEWRHVDFTQESIDIAIDYGDGDWPDLQSDLLFEEELAILSSPQHKKKDKKVLYVISKLREDNWTLWSRLKGIDEPPKEQRIYFQNTIQALQAAINGLGSIVAHIPWVVDDIKAKSLQIQQNKTLKTGKGYYLVYPEIQKDSPKIKTFRNWLLGCPLALSSGEF